MFLSLVISLLAGIGQALPIGGADSKECPFEEFSDSRGFEIPGLAGSKVIAGTRPPVDFSGVQERGLIPGPKLATGIMLLCYEKPTRRLEVSRHLEAVDDLREYSVDGRVFAYRVRSHLVVEDAIVGVSFDNVFYDEEGSGKFTLITPFRGVSIPKWARRKVNRN